MKKQTVYNRLEEQYKKLNNRIQKAIKTGRFYSFTQFKQAQLLTRLKRCSFQMKQLGAGVAVVAALGMATPSMGQYEAPDFKVSSMGDNPLYGLLETGANTKERVTMVDMDGDGDYDACQVEVSYIPSTGYYSTVVKYYENTGTPLQATFVERTGAQNLLDGIVDLQELNFVDLDNDGDLDLLGGVNNVIATYMSAPPTMKYYENQGSATAPSFVNQTGTANPLDSINFHFPSEGLLHMDFVDIDNDGDFDCFGRVNIVTMTPIITKFVYYENQGTATVPIFLRQTGINNPIDNINTNSGLINLSTVDLEFEDLDEDGDKDLFFAGKTLNNYSYFMNTGTATVPNIATPFTITGGLLDSLYRASGGSVTKGLSNLVDMDGDGDLDAYGTVDQLFLENLDTTIISSVSNISETSFKLYPIPTGGILYLEKGVTGTLHIADITGRIVLEKELNDEQQINVAALNNGIYFLVIETNKMRIREKILIQKK